MGRLLQLFWIYYILGNSNQKIYRPKVFFPLWSQPTKPEVMPATERNSIPVPSFSTDERSRFGNGEGLNEKVSRWILPEAPDQFDSAEYMWLAEEYVWCYYRLSFTKIGTLQFIVDEREISSVTGDANPQRWWSDDSEMSRCLYYLPPDSNERNLPDENWYHSCRPEN